MSYKKGKSFGSYTKLRHNLRIIFWRMSIRKDGNRTTLSLMVCLFTSEFLDILQRLLSNLTAASSKNNLKLLKECAVLFVKMTFVQAVQKKLQSSLIDKNMKATLHFSNVFLIEHTIRPLARPCRIRSKLTPNKLYIMLFIFEQFSLLLME